MLNSGESSQLTADYIIVGVGTAGAVLAHRLSENPDTTVIAIETGPSDEYETRAQQIRRWEEMIYSEYDQDYRCFSAGHGNVNIRQSRMHILGGCSTANTMIMWPPLAADLQEWEKYGVQGWTIDKLSSAYARLLTLISSVAAQDQNEIIIGVVESAAKALSVPQRMQWNNSDFLLTGQGAGFFEIGYDPVTNYRSSSSIAYLHGIMHNRPNLTVLLETEVSRINFDGSRAIGVEIITAAGKSAHIQAEKEVIICCGAIESPTLLLRSGIGPADILTKAGIPVLLDLPGVGENLQDHAEGLVVWEINRPVPPVCASGWDAGAAIVLSEDLRYQKNVLETDNEIYSPDIMMHFPVEAFVEQVQRLGVEFPENIIAIAPNISNPSSRGKIWINSADPREKPQIDYGYFTDSGGRDEQKLITAIRLARQIATVAPLSQWIVREIFPGPEVITDAEISALQRQIHQTVYHVSGTCRMGADNDPEAVLDSQFKVRNIMGLRVCDASIFPTVTSVNPVGMVLACAEFAAELIIQNV